MIEGRIDERRLLLWAMLVSSVSGLSIWYGRRLVNAPFGEWGRETVEHFSYFTNLTNGLIIVMAISLLLGRGRLFKWFSSASVQAACCLYIAFVGLAYWALLAGMVDGRSTLDWIPELTAHTLSPILGVVFWLRAIPPGQIGRRDPVIWLIYPIGYLVYWLIRGPLVGYYPYFFIDVNALGYAGVAVWTAALILVFLLLGALMLLVDRRRVAPSRWARN